MSEPLSAEVRRRTQQAHSHSEQSALMARLLGPQVSIDDHAALLSQLWFVYRAMESRGDRFDQTLIADLLDPVLHRTTSIERDLRSMLGEGAVTGLRALPATQQYVESIERAISDGDCPAFLAHHYTRYLGDLSGGAIIATNIRRVTGLGTDGGDGVRFYEFPEVRAGRFKKDYRARMDALPWSAAERDRFVGTVQTAFELNSAVFAAIVDTAPEAA